MLRRPQPSTAHPSEEGENVLQISDTAYPRLKAHPTTRELESSFTPTLAELAFAAQHTRRPASHVVCLVFLKTFQRLGYFSQGRQSGTRLLAASARRRRGNRCRATCYDIRHCAGGRCSHAG